MKHSKMLKIGLATVFGLTLVAASTLFFTEAFAQNDNDYGRGRNINTGLTAENGDRLGANQDYESLEDTALPVATVTYDQATYTLEEMITMAITDEYLARQEYEIILNAYGNINPFANIIQAEVGHIQELLPLFDTYDVTVPQDQALDHVVLPGSLQEAYETGVQAEVNNIGMYESFLKQDLPDDVREVFEELMAASAHHLQAFSRNASK